MDDNNYNESGDNDDNDDESDDSFSGDSVVHTDVG